MAAPRLFLLLLSAASYAASQAVKFNPKTGYAMDLSKVYAKKLSQTFSEFHAPKSTLDLMWTDYQATRVAPRSLHSGVLTATALIEQAYKGPCNTQRPLQIHNFLHTGFGNELQQVVSSLQLATMHGRTLVFNPATKFMWLQGTKYQLGDILRLSACQELYETSPHEWVAKDKHENRGFVEYITSNGAPTSPTSFNEMAELPPQMDPGFGKFASAKAPLTIWFKLLSGHVVQLSQMILNDLRASDVLADFPLMPTADEGAVVSIPGTSNILQLFSAARIREKCGKGAVIGLHMRGGDACYDKTRIKKEGTGCINDIESVLSQVIASQPNVGALRKGRSKCVLLATDSQKIYLKAQKVSSSLGIQIFSIGMNRDSYHITVAPSFTNKTHKKTHWQFQPRSMFIEMKKHVNHQKVMLQGLMDLALLAHADIHIGSFYSNFRRLSYQLAPATSVAYMSFDTGWCPTATCYCCGCGGSTHSMMKGIQEGRIDPHYMQVTYKPFFDIFRKKGPQGNGLKPSCFMKPHSMSSGLNPRDSSAHHQWNNLCERSRSLLQ